MNSKRDTELVQRSGPIPEAVKRGEKWGVDVGPLTMYFRSSEGATAWNTLRQMISDNVFAAPPAQQPGEVVTDEMVDRAIEGYWKSATSDGARPGISTAWMRDALTAALTPKPGKPGN